MVVSSSTNSNRRFVNITEKCNLIEKTSNYSIYEFEVTEENLNLNKTLHGGCTSTILEFCMKNAVANESERKVITVDFCISFLNAAKLGDILEIKIFILKEGRTLGFVNAEIYRKSDKKIIAIGKETIAFSVVSKL
uniref:Thioesterase domain-containing protein n=1 Tax=Panagrolaimus sp. PS1159 TaxID=55785 RepID=A0AC35GN97_9BILA